MTTDQRLERIESLLECLLEVQKIQAGMAAITEGSPINVLTRRIKAIKPIEHPKPTPESDPDSTARAPDPVHREELTAREHFRLVHE